MYPRTIESRLARCTLCALAVYMPLETWFSLPALWDPFYLVDLIAMVLLYVGARRSLRATPAPAPGMLAAGFAWTGANAWRAFWGRAAAVADGGTLTYGFTELSIVGVGTALALGALAVSLFLVARAEHADVGRTSAMPVR